MFTEVYLQHKASDNGPFKTERVDYKESPLWWQDQGLSYTATGYGNKIPSRYMVKYNGRWHRVYSCCFSNTSREYICSKGMQFTVDFY